MKHSMSGEAAITKALAEYRVGDYEAAILTLADASFDEKDYLELAYIMGLCYVRLAKYDEALLYLEQVVTAGFENARSDQCRLTLAYIYSITGRSKLAEYELKKLVAAKRESPQVYASLGFASWAQGRLEEALEWYAKALDLDPENINAINGYGYLLACADRDLSRAVSLCRKALDADPGNPAYADSLGWSYLRLGMVEEAG
ncbi:MAG: tetratricopeptide repeat protein, partial [Spirochaetales bacterium]